jgi:hypothetical protein
MANNKTKRENLKRVTVWIDQGEWKKFGKIFKSRSKEIRSFITSCIESKK